MCQRSFEEQERARQLRMKMEELWRSPVVTSAHRPCKLVAPMSLGGTHGYPNDIACDNLPERQRR